MKKILTLFSLLLTMVSYGQQRDTVKVKETAHQHLRKLHIKNLKVDSAKAEQVNEVQENYKSAVKKALSDGSLTETQRRKAVDSLKRQKNKALSDMLTPEQQDKIIPGSERTKEKKADKKQQPANGGNK